MVERREKSNYSDMPMDMMAVGLIVSMIEKKKSKQLSSRDAENHD